MARPRSEFETTKLWRQTIKKLGLLRGLTGKSQAALVDECVTARLDELYPEWQKQIEQTEEKP